MDSCKVMDHVMEGSHIMWHLIVPLKCTTSKSQFNKASILYYLNLTLEEYAMLMLLESLDHLISGVYITYR